MFFSRSSPLADLSSALGGRWRGIHIVLPKPNENRKPSLNCVEPRFFQTPHLRGVYVSPTEAEMGSSAVCQTPVTDSDGVEPTVEPT